MSDWSKEAEPYVRRQIAEALAVAAHGSTFGERVAASKIVRALVGTFLHDRVGESLAANIMNAMAQRLEDAEVIRHLLRTLIMGCTEHDKLAAGIERLAEQAADRGLREPLWHLVCGMLETTAWRTRVRGKWAGEAMAYAMSGAGSGGRQPERLIRAWLDLHSTVPEWMATAVQQRPELLVSLHLPARWVWPLHAAAPTTQGWRLLAGHLLHTCQPVEPSAFGPELDVALETLDRALGEEREPARRLALAGWLAELGGPEP